MGRIISFSLWGDQPKYFIGAVRNAELCPQVYPGWVARFYVGASTPTDIKQHLRGLGAEVFEMGVAGDWRGMFWRFEAASDPEVAVMISRDCDSRLNRREAAAVAQWMKSPAQFHIMRDHPFHGAPILGGMWGVKAPLLRNMRELIDLYEKGDFWQVDQNFLRDVIYPQVKSVALVHDEFFGGEPFPVRRRGLKFVGQAFNENERTALSDRKVLAKSLASGTLSALLRRQPPAR